MRPPTDGGPIRIALKAVSPNGGSLAIRKLDRMALVTIGGSPNTGIHIFRQDLHGVVVLGFNAGRAEFKDAAEIKNALQQCRKRVMLPTKLALVSPQIQSFTPAAGA